MPTSPIDLRPAFTSKVVAGGLRQFSARAEHPFVTQLLLDAIRAIPGSFGVVIVELGETPREWVGTGSSRSEVLESVLALRDLLGRGALDIAVFSSTEGVEIYLDRAGILEIRTGGSWEPRARTLLEDRGFRWTSRLTPPWTPPTALLPEARERLAAVTRFLDLRVATLPHRVRSN